MGSQPKQAGLCPLCSYFLIYSLKHPLAWSSHECSTMTQSSGNKNTRCRRSRLHNLVPSVHFLISPAYSDPFQLVKLVKEINMRSTCLFDFNFREENVKYFFLLGSSMMFHLKSEVVAFLCAYMQRRAPPSVPHVDLCSVSQEIRDDQVLIGGHRDLEGRLCTNYMSLLLLHEIQTCILRPCDNGRTCPLCSLISRKPHLAIFAASTYERARLPWATAMWRNLQQQQKGYS